MGFFAREPTRERDERIKEPGQQGIQNRETSHWIWRLIVTRPAQGAQGFSRDRNEVSYNRNMSSGVSMATSKHTLVPQQEIVPSRNRLVLDAEDMDCLDRLVRDQVRNKQYTQYEDAQKAKKHLKRFNSSFH
jgi:hypothetical protein